MWKSILTCKLGINLYSENWATSWENLFVSYAINKGADQPAHPRSLISAFVLRCLDSIISLSFLMCNFKTLASLWSWAGWFESYLVANPEDRFSRDEAQLLGIIWIPLRQYKWAALWQNQNNGMCAQRRLRSAWASAQSDQSGCPGWSETSLSAWSKLGSLAILRAHGEGAYQTGRMLRLSWVFAGRTDIVLVLS